MKSKSTFLFKLIFLSILIVTFLSGCSDKQEKSKATYVGSTTCISCHEKTTNLWKGSDHDMAMRIANEETVVGNFNNTSFTHFGITSKFYTRDGKYFVYTEGDEGEMQEFQIKYTFGISPLQQYLIAFPGGKLQTLPLSWDTRPVEEGGQRWFHIYDEERITPNDQLYWTGVNQNWNYMCAECHSTNLKKNYDPVNMVYNTTWNEINVSCESCHGPASLHVKWAGDVKSGEKSKYEKGKGLVTSFGNLDRDKWVLQKGSRIAFRTSPVENDNLIESCARCHSLSSTLSENYNFGDILLQSHRLSLLEDMIYYPDGQILGEDYVYGSFIQSKMFNAGVRCADCHEVHSLNTFKKGNELCTTCHKKEFYDSKTHYFHEADSKGALCTSCHMTETAFMVIDERSDHSFQIPRPDLSLKINTPNACTKCHNDKSVQWAADAFEKWYGKKNDLTYGEIIFEGRKGTPEFGQHVIDYINNTGNPAIRRATAVTTLRNYYTNKSRSTIQKILNDNEPLVRIAALSIIDVFEPVQIVKLALPFVSDTVRAVRFEAMRNLVTVQNSFFSTEQLNKINKAMNEFTETQEINSDRPETHLMWGLINTVKGNYAKADSFYNLAIRLDSSYAIAYVNLADLYRSTGKDAKGEKVLSKALGIVTNKTEVYYALGLLYTRQKQQEKALQTLKQGYENNPDNESIAYIYAIALNSNSKTNEALDILETSYKNHPYNSELLYVLTTINRDSGNNRSALKYANELVKIMPDNPSILQLKEQLDQMLN